MKSISPCYGCQERKTACHTNCEKFLHYKCEKDAIKYKLYQKKRSDWWERGYTPIRFD